METKAMDLERILDKLEEISKSIQGLSDRLTKVEVQLDGHKELASTVKDNDKRLNSLENRVVALETKLMIWSSVAAAGGGGLGLALAKLFGNS